MPDDGTVMLVCGEGGRPGVFDWFGHGVEPYHPFYHPPSGLVLLRCSAEAAKYYCERAGCYPAPAELQDADR